MLSENAFSIESNDANGETLAPKEQKLQNTCRKNQKNSKKTRKNDKNTEK